MSYFRNGVKHREDGPAEAEYDRGILIQEQYFYDGRLHRADGPAVTVYQASKHPTFTGKAGEYFHVHGSEERDDGPSMIQYDDDGVTVRVEIFRTVGKRTRIEGPTRVEYGGFGELEREYFRWKGHDLSRESFYRELGEIDDASLSAMIARSPLGVKVPADADPKLVLTALVAGIRTPEGVAEVAAGAPTEWVRAYEESKP